MSINMGSKFGLIRRATILKYNENGTVQIRLDSQGGQEPLQEYTVPMPLAWAGPNGEFMGGFPARGSSVIVKQSQGGQWFIESYIPSRGISSGLSALGEGRAVMQVKGGNRLFVDPGQGVVAGSANEFLHADPQKHIISHNYKAEMAFTEASRFVNGVVKRDVKENSTRGIVGSALDSHIYDSSLTTIPMDPSSLSAITSIGESVRNLPLVEKRELVYEFADSFDYGSDVEEATRITNPSLVADKLDNGRKESRADTLSLSLQFPNHLLEITKGTVVDSFGNILDLNRSPLPIGQIDSLSLRKNPDKSEAFARIRAEERKSIAYHFEINTRKQGIFDSSTKVEAIAPPPDVDDSSNYGRNRSRFFIDIDKEGQFKINVPSSSEVGNIALLTRYENYSNLLAKKDGVTDPNSLVRNNENRDIYLENFAGKPSIKLTGGDSTLDGYEAPIDRLTDQPIKLGTAFHDISKACANFVKGAPIINLYEENLLTGEDLLYDKIVENKLIVSGPDANAGGRSGLISTDGMISLNVGANTSDRQSLWADFAGGIVTQVGRDKRGISYAAHLDGDMLIQIGGPGIGNTYDNRFADQNDGARIGALDIRIISGDRPMTIFRLDKLGIRMATEGTLELSGQQRLVLSTQGDLQINGERVGFFTNTSKPRMVERRLGVTI